MDKGNARIGAAITIDLSIQYAITSSLRRLGSVNISKGDTVLQAIQLSDDIAMYVRHIPSFSCLFIPNGNPSHMVHCDSSTPLQQDGELIVLIPVATIQEKLLKAKEENKREQQVVLSCTTHSGLFCYDVHNGRGYQIPIKNPEIDWSSCIQVENSILITGGDRRPTYQHNGVYSVAIGTWTVVQKASMHHKKAFHAMVNLLNKYVYTVGGWDINHADYYLPYCEKYDVQQDRWLELPKLPYAQEDVICILYNDTYLIQGGGSGKSENTIAQFNVLEEDRGWVILPIIPRPEAANGIGWQASNQEIMFLNDDLFTIRISHAGFQVDKQRDEHQLCNRRRTIRAAPGQVLWLSEDTNVVTYNCVSRTLMQLKHHYTHCTSMTNS